ncbi:GspE/PulE family protein [Tepidicella baoligensis]|uniref:GspE/PulE family protein n=1 Tax=Tepidicella baoligensis TaxID=2707016 RepID=UPI001FE961B2|nr:GspE/PulE family protein [Tepidicella baoligensis]
MNEPTFQLPNIERTDVFPVGEAILACTVEGWSDNTVSGHLLDFDTERRVLKLRLRGEERSLSLKFNQVKRLRIQHHAPTDTEFSPTGLPGADASQAQSFVVFLRDGSLYSGICYRYEKTDQGLWIFPKRNLDGDPYRVFVPKNGIVRLEIREGDEALISDADFAQTMLYEGPVEPAFTSETVEKSTVETHEELLEALRRQSSLKPVPIGQALVGLGKITVDQLNAVLKLQQADKKRPLGQILLEKKLVTAADLQTAFARKMGYPFVDLAKFPIDASALRRVPFALALRLQVLPILDQGKSIVVAMTDPLQFKVIDELEFTTQRKVIPVVSTSGELVDKIKKAYREIGMSDLASATSSSKAAPATAPAGEPSAAQVDAMQLAVELTGEAVEVQDDERPIEQSDNTLVRLINSMITEAYYQRASDIHIEPYPGREKLVIRFRVDGQMRPYLELPSSYRNALIARIKIMCDLDISERRKPQDGKIHFAKFGGLAIELRVATIPTVNGLEDVVLRILSSSEPMPLDKLQLSPHNLAAFEAIVERPYGLFLCAGPTGSGKTTTLHSALRQINTPSRKIWTAEDPVEITQRGLRQIQVNPKIGWTFAAALRALLRADPDVIMVGEIRDQETAEIAIEAALTGHLVLSTLHTNSAAETVVRLVDLGVDPFSFADSLQGILAQRLVRRLCLSCIQTEAVSKALLEELIADYQAQLPYEHPLRDHDTLMADWLKRFGRDGQLFVSHASGCDRCGHTGFYGRLAVHELMSNSAEMRHLIQSRSRPTEVQVLAIQEGMRTLRQDGIEKVLQGLTSLAEVRSSTLG